VGVAELGQCSPAAEAIPADGIALQMASEPAADYRTSSLLPEALAALTLAM
jgi:hypothetical protein